MNEIVKNLVAPMCKDFKYTRDVINGILQEVDLRIITKDHMTIAEIANYSFMICKQLESVGLGDMRVSLSWDVNQSKMHLSVSSFRFSEISDVHKLAFMGLMSI